MPELDFMFIADYVRTEGNKIDALGASFDTMTVPSVPMAIPLGIGMRVTVTRPECGRQHSLEILIQGEDGNRVAEIRNVLFVAEPPDPTTPPHWPIGALLALNVPIPIPRAGIYSLELMINDDHKKSVPLRIVVGGQQQVQMPPQA